MTTKLTLGEWLHQLAHQYKDRPAVTEVASDKMMTYLELEQFTNRIAHGFKTLPHASTTYVGIMHENSLSYLAMTYALKKLALVEVSINRAFRGPALSRMINLTQAEILMTSQAHFEPLQEVINDLPHLKLLLVTDGLKQAQDLFPHLKIIDFWDMLSDEDSQVSLKDVCCLTAMPCVLLKI